MSYNKLTRDEFIKKLSEFKNLRAVIETGMPQATAHEQRALGTRYTQLERELAESPWYEHKSGDIRKKGFGYSISEMFK